mmetsp:Transcript_45098/g.95869  ORF Transcript_45098/g.95869 Transcript_45098/m.95869 type:complete len:213 (+) Transcript_45098:328-966(+)
MQVTQHGTAVVHLGDELVVGARDEARRGAARRRHLAQVLEVGVTHRAVCLDVREHLAVRSEHGAVLGERRPQPPFLVDDAETDPVHRGAARGLESADRLLRVDGHAGARRALTGGDGMRDRAREGLSRRLATLVSRRIEHRERRLVELAHLNGRRHRLIAPRRVVLRTRQRVGHASGARLQRWCRQRRRERGRGRGRSGGAEARGEGEARRE